MKNTDNVTPIQLTSNENPHLIPHFGTAIFNMEPEDNCHLEDPEEHLSATPLAGAGGARPKQYSNVIVDDSPLQNQMEKNKECKCLETKMRH